MRLADTDSFADEGQCVALMLAALTPLEAHREAIFARAGAWVKRIRETGSKGVEAFLHSYGLNTQEGVALMCLAEALLRIPDPATANRLIHGTFEHTHWESHLGDNDSFFVNASGWGLLLTGTLVHLGDMHGMAPASVLGRLAGKLGEPLVREALKQAMRFIGAQFVLGETIEEALQKSSHKEKQGYRFSYDILGEGARTQAQAEGYVKAYLHAIAAIASRHEGRALMDAPGISVKLSALHPRYQLVKEKRVMSELLPRLREIVRCAMDAGISVSIDAEEASRLDIGLKIYRALLTDPAFAGYNGIGFVLQAYQKRALFVVDTLIALCRETGKRIPLRLVKGAYWDSEIKTAQVLGLPSYPVFTRKEHTDVSYMACAQKILGARDCFYPQFGTHNALTAASIMQLAGDHPGAFEFQRLHGMGETLHDQLVQDVPCRIYAPVGKYEDLLAYLIRRLLENGANTSFVNALMDKQKPLEELLEDPVACVRLQGDALAGGITDPARLYPDRRNSRGYDLGYAVMLEAVLAKTAPFLKQPLPAVTPATQDEVQRAFASAVAAFPHWQKSPVEVRASILEKLADLLEAHEAEAIALAVAEAGKTLPDAIAELREAVDYCRYYAQQARRLIGTRTLAGPTGEQNTLELVARGVFVCISPWNFPLAIFAGQVVAALVTGNCVLAKPAAQTPKMAAFAVRLMHEAGIPQSVLHLLHGEGAVVGRALVGDERIAGVAFTGSVETARLINRALASRNGPIVPFIAETGGQNCMIVDSSALPEQAVDDIIASAFGSAGQRCSALRVLYVQEDIADRLITLIAGAMQELAVGEACNPATDIGPVIDTQARQKLLAHIENMKQSARFIAATPLVPEMEVAGKYVAPHAFELKSISELPGEVFGPVLHVIRFNADGLEGVCDAINATGFGLTFGMQSRIGENVEKVRKRIRAGNVYVNRSMIGATVGVQPFGGEGLSGTGPKAGGPHYLLRFVTERTVSVNTAAIGGNLELLSTIR